MGLQKHILVLLEDEAAEMELEAGNQVNHGWRSCQRYGVQLMADCGD